ncbi:MAG: glycosyltransferase family 4 protein [Leucobacter sp.]|nr:glycosyltransferase family 4 protein [Leucobacter sp.]
MRVAIATRIYRPEPAAASLFLGSVADELLALGHEVDVYTATPPSDISSESHGERIRTAPVHRDKNGYVRGIAGYISFDVPLLFRLMFCRKPDVVFVEPPPTTGAVVRVVCALRRIPYVYDAADIWSDAAQLEPVSGLVVRVLRAIERFALRGATHTVTVSEGVVKRVRELGSQRPVTVTGFGADTNQFPLTESPAEDLFLYAGSYSPYHGADVLIDGFAKFLKTHPGYTLRFIGNGATQPALEQRAEELGITANVQHLDPVPPYELLTHLGSAVASLATIKPGTVYEYSYASKAFSSLMAGCPVIFAGPGPTIDLLESANTQVRAGVACEYTPSAVAAAMAGLADRRATQEERRKLSEWTAAEHSLQAVTRRIANIIFETANTRRTGRGETNDG